MCHSFLQKSHYFNSSYMLPTGRRPHWPVWKTDVLVDTRNCFYGRMNWKKVQDENFRRRLSYSSLHCESCGGLSSCLHVRQPFKGLHTHRHVFSLEQLTSLGAMKSLERNPISALDTTAVPPHIVLK